MFAVFRKILHEEWKIDQFGPSLERNELFGFDRETPIDIERFGVEINLKDLNIIHMLL